MRAILSGGRLLAWVAGFVLAGATAGRAECPRDAVWVAVGDDLGAMAAAAKPGTAFCIANGVHRLQQVVPKRGQRFFGQAGAVLNGARLVTRFTRRGRVWVAGGQTQQGERLQRRECLPERPRCSHPEAFFIDDVPLLAVASRGELVPGTFFFDYAADEILFLDDPRGRRVEASVSPYAFLGGARGVVVDGLVVEKYSTPIQRGAIGAGTASPGWTVRDNEVRLNYAVGVVVGSGSRVLGNHIHDNGEMGIGCVGDDILIEDNEIAGNGFFSGLDPLWEGGGGKCALTRRLVVRDNYSHDNNAYGFWTDIDNIDTLYEGNRIEDNVHGGISHEISYRAVIRDNRFEGNGFGVAVWLWGGAIQIQNSRDVEVTGNLVDTGGVGNGITLIQQDRGRGAYGRHDTVGNTVHHNRIVAPGHAAGASGAIADFAPARLAAGGNRFEHNVYVVPSGRDDRWAWVDGFYDWATYRRVSGQDATSRLVRP